MKNTLRIVILALCALAPVREVSAAFLIRDGKLQTDLNANTNRITNATDYVTVGGVSLTNLAANLGGGTGTLYRIESQVSGLGFTTPNGPTAFLTGTVATAGSFADTNSVGVISTNAVNQATNFVARAGDTMTGNLIITNASITVKSDSINAQFSDARGAAGVLLQTGSPSAATNTYGVVKLQDSGPSAGYGTLYFDSRVSPTGLWIKASGTNRWNVWDQRNDGAGSGLDADLLDGLESTNFAQLASSPTFTGTITAGGFSGNGAGITNVTASALNGNAAQSLLTNNLVIQGTAPVTVTTTTGGNITTATVSLATGGTLPTMNGANLTNIAGVYATNTLNVMPHWMRTQAGATSIWSYADLGGGDALTVSTATNLESYGLIFQTAQAGSLQQLTREGAIVSPVTGTNVLVDVKGNGTNGSATITIYNGAASTVRTQSLVGAAGTIYTLNIPISFSAWRRLGVNVAASVQNTNAATATGQLGVGNWRVQP